MSPAPTVVSLHLAKRSPRGVTRGKGRSPTRQPGPEGALRWIRPTMPETAPCARGGPVLASPTHPGSRPSQRGSGPIDCRHGKHQTAAIPLSTGVDVIVDSWSGMEALTLVDGRGHPVDNLRWNAPRAGLRGRVADHLRGARPVRADDQVFVLAVPSTGGRASASRAEYLTLVNSALADAGGGTAALVIEVHTDDSGSSSRPTSSTWASSPLSARTGSVQTAASDLKFLENMNIFAWDWAGSIISQKPRRRVRRFRFDEISLPVIGRYCSTGRRLKRPFYYFDGCAAWFILYFTDAKSA